MANWIYVCCRTASPLTYGQLEGFMGHVGFLDKPAWFDPPLDDLTRADPAWGSFCVHYASDRRPIVVRHLPEDVWEMLDATEVFIARECDGIVIAEDGAFDADLVPIMTWSSA